MKREVVRAAWFLVLVLFACAVGRDSVAEDRGPFVTGFERFARYGELEQVNAGRLLISELSCVACHPSEDAQLAPKRGPDLDGAAIRLNQQWMQTYIAAPHSANPHTTMPDVLGNRSEVERQAIAKSIVAFLSTQQRPPDEVKGSGAVPVPHEFWKKGDPARGNVLYHQVGCVACHEADQEHAVASKSSPVDQLIAELDAEELAELGLSAAAREVPSVPLSDLSAKYSVTGLTHFLLDPHQFRKSSRMPALKLSPVEAADVASYLLRDQPIDQLELSEELKTEHSEEQIEVGLDEVETGKRWFVELSCVQCHSVDNLRPTARAKPLANLDLAARNRCWDSDARTVDYQLDADQVTALTEALRAEQTLNTPAEQFELLMLTFNCYACHERDGRGGVARFRRDHFETVAKVDLGDEGRLPPPLTGVGRKLQSAWLKNVLLGKKADVRPHMHIRMPIFHTELANRMPELFRVSDDERNQNEVAVLQAASDSVEAGRQLMDVGCVQCHLFGGSALPDVVGVDIRGIGGRVREEWFRDFLLNPSALKARTRMPSFFPDGISQRPDLLNGDVDRQIAAMWAYLNAKGEVELPERISEARARNFELRPTDKPIVLRTFMEEAGTHAIAVGFPQQVHFAFDAESMRLAVGWRGKFLDAQGTWFVRSAPPAEPLSNDVTLFAEAVAIAELNDMTRAWPQQLSNESTDNYNFTGYRLDATGVPTFLYRFKDVDIEDRIEPKEIDGVYELQRSLTLRNVSKNSDAKRMVMLAATGKRLSRVSDQSVKNETGLTTTLNDRQGTLRSSSGRDEWLVPIELESALTVELQYQW